MTVTSVTTLAVSFRTMRFGTSAAADVPVSGAAPDAPPTAEPAAPPAPPVEPAPSTSTVSSRATALFQRLDSDESGSISKDEFTAGAIDLLKRASVREHHRHVGHGHGIDKRDAKWLARLEKAFDRIDANNDGSVDQGELSAPLSRAGSESGTDGATQQPAATSVTSVTIVAIAIRRYTAAAAAAPAPTETPTSPEATEPAPPTAEAPTVPEPVATESSSATEDSQAA